MLVIPGSQLDAISEIEREAFLVQLRASVLAAMADASPDTPTSVVDARIDRGLASASARGILTERQITRYVHALAAFPDGHEVDPDYAWLSRVLDGPGSPDHRLDRVYAVLNGGGA